MLDAKSETDVTTARNLITKSRERLEPFLQIRQEFRNTYLGHNYGEGWKDKEQDSVNPVEEFITAYVRQVVAKEPRVNIVPSYPEYASQALKLEAKTNREIVANRFKKVARRSVFEAMTGLGIVWTGFVANGRTVSKLVTLDDAVLDQGAGDLDEMRYAAHRYRVPANIIAEQYGAFTAAALEHAAPTERHESGIERDKEQEIGARYMQHDREIGKVIELYDIWWEETNEIWTLPHHGPTEIGPYRTGVLRKRQFIGPGRSPYEYLKFLDVPGLTMPLAPVAASFDLATYLTIAYRKELRRIIHGKMVPWAVPEAIDDLRRALEVEDLKGIKAPHAAGIGQLNLGGSNPQNLMTLLHVRRAWSDAAGGMDHIAGLRPVAPTARQEEIVKSNASIRLEDMQDEVYSHIEACVRRIAWHIWTGSTARDERVPVRLPSTNETWSLRFPEPEKRADFLRFDLKIEPYSMARKTPNEKLQTALVMWDKMMQMGPEWLAANGITPDPRFLIDFAAEATDTPELRQLLRHATEHEVVRLQSMSNPRPQMRLGTPEGGAGRTPGPTARSEDDELLRQMQQRAGQDAEAA